MLAERGFDPRTSGLWAQHASTAPLCFLLTVYQHILLAKLLVKNSSLILRLCLCSVMNYQGSRGRVVKAMD